MGNNQDPITLHKYLYANVDPANNVDPSGNFSLGSIGTAINVVGTLSTVASTTYNVFQIATGEKEFSWREFGTSVLLNRLPVGYVAKLLKKYAAKTGIKLKITCLNNSFVEGTLVHTKDGLIPIEDIKIGDMVFSFNEETGDVEYQDVIHLIGHTDQYDIVSFIEGADELIEATLGHPLYADSSWINAGELSIGDSLKTLNGVTEVKGVSIGSKEVAVYNLTVDKNHTYYVGEEGLLAHNCADKVNNMGEFFTTQFGIGLKSVANKTTRQFQGQSIYKVSKASGPMGKGDHFYLDNLHKDHLEVFDKNGKFRFVLNLDGTMNHEKTASALGRSIRDIIK